MGSEQIQLSGKFLADQHMKELSGAIKRCPDVHSLDLSNNRVTDEGLLIISEVISESGIKNLNLSGNRIGDKNIDSIVQILKRSRTLS